MTDLPPKPLQALESDRLELLRLRVGIGPTTLGDAHWAIIARRTDGCVWIELVAKRHATRTECIRAFSEAQKVAHPKYRWPAEPNGWTDRKLSCERVVIAYNYQEPNGP